MEEWNMTCNNDWDDLKEIIVGVADFANIPVPNISVLKCQFPEYEESYIKQLTGYYPKQIIDEQNEDLDILTKTLQDLSIIVIDLIQDLQKKNFYHLLGKAKIGIITALVILL